MNKYLVSCAVTLNVKTEFEAEDITLKTLILSLLKDLRDKG